MKVSKIIKFIFIIVGSGMLTWTFFIYNDTRKFLKTSVETQGTVIKLSESVSNSSSDNSIMYRPVVQFTDNEGNLIEFSSSTSSNTPSYSIGEKVEVLYNQESPGDAKIKGFFSIWGKTTILGTLGVVFFTIGGAVFLFNMKKKNKIKYLEQNGIKIETNFQSVEINHSYSKNGRHPYRIITHWINPTTSKLHILKSDNIWFNPSDYIKTDKIQVLIDKNNFKRYSVDLSFLPEIEN